MTLSDLIAEVERRRKTIVAYSDAEAGEILRRFEGGTVDVEHRSLPSGGPGGFIVIREADEFVGAMGLSKFREIVSPPHHRPWDAEGVDSGYRALFEILDGTIFTSFDRGTLLAAAREIETTAWRVGRGTLHVGFQSLSALRSQIPVYRRLGVERALDIHLYGSADWNPPALANTTIHAESADEIGSYWFLVYDGGDDRECRALIAEERSPNEYYGFWTVDTDIVAEGLRHLQRTYG